MTGGKMVQDRLLDERLWVDVLRVAGDFISESVKSLKLSWLHSTLKYKEELTPTLLEGV